MDKYLARRWKHAKGARVKHVVPLGKGHYKVQSSAGGWYRVSVVFHQNKLRWAHCACADCGETRLHGVAFCKHIGEASIAAYAGKAFAQADPEAHLGELL